VRALGLLLLALACARPVPAAPPAPPPAKEASMTTPTSEDIRIGETEVARLGAWKVALAKCFADNRHGAKVPLAWLSVVEKGSDAGPRDVELGAGDPLTLGSDTYEVVEVTLQSGDKPGTVLLRKKEGK